MTVRVGLRFRTTTLWFDGSHRWHAIEAKEPREQGDAVEFVVTLLATGTPTELRDALDLLVTYRKWANDQPGQVLFLIDDSVEEEQYPVNNLRLQTFPGRIDRLGAGVSQVTLVVSCRREVFLPSGIVATNVQGNAGEAIPVTTSSAGQLALARIRPQTLRAMTKGYLAATMPGEWSTSDLRLDLDAAQGYENGWYLAGRARWKPKSRRYEVVARVRGAPNTTTLAIRGVNTRIPGLQQYWRSASGTIYGNFVTNDILVLRGDGSSAPPSPWQSLVVQGPSAGFGFAISGGVLAWRVLTANAGQMELPAGSWEVWHLRGYTSPQTATATFAKASNSNLWQATITLPSQTVLAFGIAGMTWRVALPPDEPGQPWKGISVFPRVSIWPHAALGSGTMRFTTQLTWMMSDGSELDLISGGNAGALWFTPQSGTLGSLNGTYRIALAKMRPDGSDGAVASVDRPIRVPSGHELVINVADRFPDGTYRLYLRTEPSGTWYAQTVNPAQQLIIKSVGSSSAGPQSTESGTIPVRVRLQPVDTRLTEESATGNTTASECLVPLGAVTVIPDAEYEVIAESAVPVTIDRLYLLPQPVHWQMLVGDGLGPHEFRVSGTPSSWAVDGMHVTREVLGATAITRRDQEQIWLYGAVPPVPLLFGPDSKRVLGRFTNTSYSPEETAGSGIPLVRGYVSATEETFARFYVAGYWPYRLLRLYVRTESGAATLTVKVWKLVNNQWSSMSQNVNVNTTLQVRDLDLSSFVGNLDAFALAFSASTNVFIRWNAIAAVDPDLVALTTGLTPTHYHRPLVQTSTSTYLGYSYYSLAVSPNTTYFIYATATTTVTLSIPFYNANGSTITTWQTNFSGELITSFQTPSNCVTIQPQMQGTGSGVTVSVAGISTTNPLWTGIALPNLTTAWYALPLPSSDRENFTLQVRVEYHRSSLASGNRTLCSVPLADGSTLSLGFLGTTHIAVWRGSTVVVSVPISADTLVDAVIGLTYAQSTLTLVHRSQTTNSASTQVTLPRPVGPCQVGPTENVTTPDDLCSLRWVLFAWDPDATLAAGTSDDPDFAHLVEHCDKAMVFLARYPTSPRFVNVRVPASIRGALDVVTGANTLLVFPLGDPSDMSDDDAPFELDLAHAGVRSL